MLDDFLKKLAATTLDDLKCCSSVLTNPLDDDDDDDDDDANNNEEAEIEIHKRKIEDWLLEIKGLIRERIQLYKDDLLQNFPSLAFFSRDGASALVKDLMIWQTAQQEAQPNVRTETDREIDR